MNKELSLALLSKLSDIVYLDRTSGCVQVVESVIEGDNSLSITKKIPVTSLATYTDTIDNAQLVDMIPDGSYMGMLYFEDNGINNAVKKTGGMSYVSRLRLVCWLNTQRITGKSDMLLCSRVMSDVIERITAGVYNSGPFLRIQANVENIPVQDSAIFSKYDYSETQTQYLMAPFEFFAIDLVVNFIVPFNCSSEIEVMEANQC